MGSTERCSYKVNSIPRPENKFDSKYLYNSYGYTIYVVVRISQSGSTLELKIVYGVLFQLQYIYRICIQILDTWALLIGERDHP